MSELEHDVRSWNHDDFRDRGRATMRSSRRLAAALLLTSILIPCVKADEDPSPLTQETKAEKDARMKWWREARFGLFIHWGI
jgi:alpha-L-fucosidase